MIQEPNTEQQIIIDTVLAYYKLDLDDFYIHKISRKPEYLEPRQMCMIFLAKYNALSNANIARLLGKDDATVFSGKKHILGLLHSNDKKTVKAYWDIDRMLSSIDFQKLKISRKPLPEDTIYGMLGFYPNPNTLVTDIHWSTIISIMKRYVNDLKY